MLRGIHDHAPHPRRTAITAASIAAVWIAVDASTAHAQQPACEHSNATSVFELAASSPLLARAEVVRTGARELFLVALESHRGTLAPGERIDLVAEDLSLRHGEQVLVFARGERGVRRAAAGPRAILRDADTALGGELALYAALPEAERAPLAAMLARRSARCRADLPRSVAPLRPVERPSSAPGGLLETLRARRANADRDRAPTH